MMKLLFYKIYSVPAWIAMVLSSIIFTPFFLLVWVSTFWWDRRRVASQLMSALWAWIFRLIIIYWRFKMEDRQKIPRNRPSVIVSNHRSQVDILSHYKIRRHFKWASKSENFRMPFVGMVLKLTRAIPVDRHSLRSGSKFIARAEAEIKKGSSVLLFPEGTRSKTGSMGAFKEGAFLLAKKTGCPIIPIVHTGSENTFPGSTWIMGKAHIRIRVLDEIPAHTVSILDVRSLMKLTREIMEAGLAVLEKE
ncbi:MAG: lysophospholipid acyltransferase family protein [Bacteroidales bacterium]